MKKYLGLSVVGIFGIIAVLDLLHPGFAVTHDGQDHIARIANFYMNLQQGNFVPRWAANLNWGYGHPILEFLYPLPSYVASLFHFVGLSLINSTKLVYALSMIASGLSMYFFVKSLWGKSAGVVSGILYMYAPYHFVDLYVRGDIGEMVAFVFVPLVFLGALLVANKQSSKHVCFFSFSIALLIFSHNAIALMVTPLLVVYAILLWWQAKWQRKLGLFLGISFLLGFLLSGFFWFPALLEGQYTLRNIVTKGGYTTSFVSISQLLYGPWNYGGSGMFTVQLGIFQWIFVAASASWFVFAKKKNTHTSIFIFGLLATTLCAIFLMLPISNFLWEHLMILQNFQFTWRFLAIPIFTTAIVGGFCISRISQKWRILTAIIVCCLVLFLSKDYLHAKAYAKKPESFFNGIYKSTTDTGESSPIWSIRFMEHGFAKPLQAISGEAIIIPEKRLVTKHVYHVIVTDQARLLENTLYFPGWKITVDGKIVPIQFQDPMYRGLMTFFIGNGVHTIIVSYHESKLRLIGDMLSVIGILGLCLFLVFVKIKKYE